MANRFVLPMTLAVLAVVTGCRNDEVATTAGVTDTSTTSFTAAGPSLVRVEFDGLISHILGQTPNRAALIDDSFHASALLVYKPTKIGKDPAESQQRLLDALPTGFTASCDPNFCEVTPLKGLLIRIVDGSNGPIQPSPVTPGADFNILVPRLNKISTMPDVSDLLDDATPTGDFIAFFELNGGTLSATPYCEPAELKKPNGTSLGEFDFARTVLLTGTTPTTAQLQFSDDGTTWKSVVMDRAAVLNLRIENRPDQLHAGMPHLDLHKKIAKNPVNDFPSFAAVKLCQAGTAVGCSNSAWP